MKRVLIGSVVSLLVFMGLVACDNPRESERIRQFDTSCTSSGGAVFVFYDTEPGPDGSSEHHICTKDGVVIADAWFWS